MIKIIEEKNIKQNLFFRFVFLIKKIDLKNKFKSKKLYIIREDKFNLLSDKIQIGNDKFIVLPMDLKKYLITEKEVFGFFGRKYFEVKDEKK